MNVTDILKELVAVPGISATASEKAAGDKVYEMLSKIDYFAEHEALLGRYPCPGDMFGREVIYGIIKGCADKTVVLMGHYDVVGIEDYGKIKDYAFDTETLPDKLRDLGIDESVAEDIRSGQWIFGRGAADMKAGLAINLWLMHKLSATPQRGNILFLAVPDEENFSVGMRAAAPLLRELKQQHGFDYELCLITEPGKRTEGGHVDGVRACGERAEGEHAEGERADSKHVISIGTVGKCMPVILVQGAKAHISMCFDGLNPLGILSEIFRATELNPAFSDEYNGARTMPPSWLYLRDMKYEYDVSLPIRAGGYFSVLSYYSTPDETMDKLRIICEDAFRSCVSRMCGVYSDIIEGGAYPAANGLSYEPAVMDYAGLSQYCESLEGYEEFRVSLYEQIKHKLEADELNMPRATIEMMARTLDFSGITKPVVLLAFAPPYYSPLRSDNVKGKENKAREYFEFIRDKSAVEFGVESVAEEYFGGIADLSYCALDRAFEISGFRNNTPLWGDVYSIDFEAVADINIPGILFGPWGKCCHQAAERVYRPDVETRVPALIEQLIEYIFGG